MPLTRLGRQVVIGSTCVMLGAVFGSINYALYEISVNQDLRLWMHRRYPSLLEAFYRSCEHHPDSPCWYRTWDEKVIKQLQDEAKEKTNR